MLKSQLTHPIEEIDAVPAAAVRITGLLTTQVEGIDELEPDGVLLSHVHRGEAQRGLQSVKVLVLIQMPAESEAVNIGAVFLCLQDRLCLLETNFSSARGG